MLTVSVPRTSELVFFSSLHGRARREQRGIDKRDLQAAVKYGRREMTFSDPRTGRPRWKYTYANIVYITDESSTREITSWKEPLAIPHAGLTQEQVDEHDKTRKWLLQNPSLCTSHTVIVVDQSASMRRSDVLDFRSRSEAVFATLSLDFVAKQRLAREGMDTCVVSLVRMDHEGHVLFEREPMGLVLYNKFVDLHHSSLPASHGNYLPALDEAERLLKRRCHCSCALCLLFLSDGRPSDKRIKRRELEAAMAGRVQALASIFGQQLTVGTVGFAAKDSDFSILRAMAKAAREAGAKVMFHQPELSSSGLGTAIAQSVTSLTATRVMLTSLATRHGELRAPLRQVEREAAAIHWTHDRTIVGVDDGWSFYTVGVMRCEYSDVKARCGGSPWFRVEPFCPRANGIAIKNKALGQGAQRLVFGMQEIEVRNNIKALVGPRLVAKESCHDTSCDNIDFHQSFAKTQLMASRIAVKFNEKVKDQISLLGPSFRSRHVAKITFLPCWVYFFREHGVMCRVLVEKMLPPRGYTKWNSNNGYVLHLPVAETSENMVQGKKISTIQEGDEDGTISSTSSGLSYLNGTSDAGNRTRLMPGISIEGAHEKTIVCVSDIGSDKGNYIRGASPPHQSTGFHFSPQAGDFPQAFSHFSYVHTKRKMLVCDLQGILSKVQPPVDGRSGVFELTDPVIHYKSTKGRRQVYGHTDMGMKGVQEFFKTHMCNDVCQLLGIAGFS
ncbi:unnamed protein product [Choristocarpus tenellus]